MTGVIFMLAGIAAFYLLVYRKWNYSNQFTFKTISFYLLLGVTAIMLWAAVNTVSEVAENEQYKMPERRLATAEDTARRRDYIWLIDFLRIDKDYEEEFEYLWERVTMYSACNRYLIFEAADRAGLGETYGKRAQEYEELLREIGGNPLYEENIPYGKAFMEKAGLNQD